MGAIAPWNFQTQVLLSNFAPTEIEIRTDFIHAVENKGTKIIILTGVYFL